MTNYIKASDFTPQFIDNSILDMMKGHIEGVTVFDFLDRYLMDRDLLTLAEIVVETGVGVEGLDEDSMDLLDSYIRKLNEPDYEDLDEFKEMFNIKFPKDTICIWDKSLCENILPNENILTLVQIIGIEGVYVKFRQYKSHLIEPKYVHKYGGMDAEELYTVSNVHISDISNKTVMFRNPVDEREELIIDILKSI